MSGRSAPGGGPRRPAGPRDGSRRRGPGGARSGGQLLLDGHAAAQAPARGGAVAAATADAGRWEQDGRDARTRKRRERRERRAREREHRRRPEPRLAAIQGELSGLRLLLAQLDELLRDPTLTLALKAFAARVAGGMRELGAATADAARRLARALARLRIPFPRRVLLGLLALTLPLALLALLLGSQDDDRAPAGATAGRSQAAGGGFSLPGAGMPEPASADTRPGAVDVALVVDRGDPALRRELRTLGAWLDEHHAAGTRVSLVDARSGRATVPVPPARLADAALPTRARSSTSAAVGAALARERGRRRLLVTVGSRAAAPAGVDTLRVATRRGAATSLPARRGRRSSVTIDERRPDALAASIARAVMAISGQSERR